MQPQIPQMPQMPQMPQVPQQPQPVQQPQPQQMQQPQFQQPMAQPPMAMGDPNQPQMMQQPMQQPMMQQPDPNQGFQQPQQPQMQQMPMQPPMQQMPMQPQPMQGMAPTNPLQALAQAASPIPPGGGGDFFSIVSQADYSQVQLSGASRLLDTTKTYEAVVTEVKEETATSSGNPKLAIKATSCWPPEDAGIQIYDDIVYTGDNPWKWKSFATACELMDPSGSRCIARGVHEFVKKVIRFGIRHSEYPVGSGNWRNKVNQGYEKAYQYQSLPGQGQQQQAPQMMQQPMQQQPMMQPGMGQPMQPQFQQQPMVQQQPTQFQQPMQPQYQQQPMQPGMPGMMPQAPGYPQ